MYNQEWINTFEEYAQQLVEEHQIPDAVIGIAQDGKPFYQNGFGFNDAESRHADTAWENGKHVLRTEDMQELPMQPIGEDLFLIKRRRAETCVRHIRDSNHDVVRISFGFRQIPKLKGGIPS